MGPDVEREYRRCPDDSMRGQQRRASKGGGAWLQEPIHPIIYLEGLLLSSSASASSAGPPPHQIAACVLPTTAACFIGYAHLKPIHSFLYLAGLSPRLHYHLRSLSLPFAAGFFVSLLISDLDTPSIYQQMFALFRVVICAALLFCWYALSWKALPWARRWETAIQASTGFAFITRDRANRTRQPRGNGKKGGDLAHWQARGRRGLDG